MCVRGCEKVMERVIYPKIRKDVDFFSTTCYQAVKGYWDTYAPAISFSGNILLVL